MHARSVRVLDAIDASAPIGQSVFDRVLYLFMMVDIKTIPRSTSHNVKWVHKEAHARTARDRPVGIDIRMP
jgi:hypothetical protein